MSDLNELLAFARRAARNGTPVDGRQVGYLLAELDRLREDKRILQEVAQEMGGIVDAVTAELGIRRDAGPDTIVANIRAVLRIAR